MSNGTKAPGDRGSPGRIAALKARAMDLPLLPTVVGEMLSLDPGTDDYFERILQLAETDPPLAARILKIANSPWSAPVTPISSLRQAVTRLGSRQCGELLLAAAVMKVFIPRSDGERLLWLHSVQTAAIAGQLARHAPGISGISESAYVCGLLHDVGRFIQFERARDDLSSVDDAHWASPRELVEVEVAVLGYAHTELGWYACQKWQLPVEIAEVVRRHHDYDPPPGAVDGAARRLDVLTRCIQWADAISIAMSLDDAFATSGCDVISARFEEQFRYLSRLEAPVEVAVWCTWLPGIDLQVRKRIGQLGLH